jgi:hypothetical protein
MIKIILWLPLIMLVALISLFSTIFLYCYLYSHKIMGFLLKLFVKDLATACRGTVFENLANNLYYQIENNK